MTRENVDTLGPCTECSQTMIPQRLYNQKPELRKRYVKVIAHGLCGTCYMRARRQGTLDEAKARHAAKQRGLSDAELARLRSMVGVAR